MSDAEKIAEVLAAHWSFTTDSNQNPFVDRCDGCKEAVYSWGSPASEQQKARPAHQAQMVAAALEPANVERERVAWDEGRVLGKDVCAWAIGNRPDTERPDENNPYDTKEEA